MKVLFLVDGAAGTGKSDLVNYIAKTNQTNVTKIEKFTTREKRPREEEKKLDLKFITDKEFDALQANKKDRFFEYLYGGARYGFKKSQIDQAIQHFYSTFLIVRNQALITQLCEIYGQLVRVVPIYIYTDMGLIKKRLRKDGYDKETIQLRISRSEAAFAEYLENDIFRNVIINRSNVTDLHRKIKMLVEKYTTIDKQEGRLYVSPTQYFKLHSLSSHRAAMLEKIEKYPYDKNVFLMMKFRDSNKPLSDFIKDEIQHCGYTCVRADEKEWHITSDVYNPIAVLYCCKYGIALFDEPEDGANYNPNVAYELGIMQNQGKKCLILKHSSLKDKEMPFDLIKDLHRVYEKEFEFRHIIKDWLYSLHS
jgi:guanylate kinase